MSTIEWTGETWNPLRGCRKVSPGCKHCYAETFAERWRGVPGHPYEQGFDPRLVRTALDVPRAWAKPRTIFVGSMSDLFGEFVPDTYVAEIFGVMASTERHRYQVLTKRAERMVTWFAWLGSDDLRLHDAFWSPWPLPNVDIGVSVEDRDYGLPRIAHLRRVPIGAGAVRFLSIEPLLEDLGPIDLTGIGWVIVGGESGQQARRCDVAWLRSVVAECDRQGVPVFVKQLGSRPDGTWDGGVVRLRARGSLQSTWPPDLIGRRALPAGRTGALTAWRTSPTAGRTA